MTLKVRKINLKEIYTADLTISAKDKSSLW